MYLNQLSPGLGAKKAKTRVGRGIGCGKGKTCGRGHKGQSSRAGGYHKVGFEGGQMPLQRRLPKFGFNSRLARVTDEVTLGEINKISHELINLAVLKDEGLVRKDVKYVKIIGTGQLDRAVTVAGLRVTKGARELIEAAKGKIEE